VLSLVSERPKHGYELMKELEARSGGSYRVSAGTMYPTLQMLEDEGMVTSEQHDGKRVYSLTDLGRAELRGKRPRSMAFGEKRRIGAIGDRGLRVPSVA
jgi:DNA-binding PadR family transcriptional regulator